MLKVVSTNVFRKEYKILQKRGEKIELLDDVIRMLVKEKELPPKYKNHPLKGNYIGYMECHIRPDWLLIYRIEKDKLVLLLSRTGAHSDLF